jgi:hypothetical protein
VHVEPPQLARYLSSDGDELKTIIIRVGELTST